MDKFLRAALDEAQKGLQEGGIPIGSVIVYKGEIIGKGHNRTEALCDPTAHAEILAITAAANHQETWRLDDCTCYSTLEPCAMCAGALVLARIERLVFGAKDPKFGACGSIFEIPTEQKLNHTIEIISGLMEQETAELMQRFFREIRGKENKR